MDEETIDLVRRLLLHAGMAMEDVCDMAVVSPSSPEALQRAVSAVRSGVSKASRLTQAAEALIDAGSLQPTSHD
jgi:hypothetical protein